MGRRVRAVLVAGRVGDGQAASLFKALKLMGIILMAVISFN
jgi:hypothetical protein